MGWLRKKHNKKSILERKIAVKEVYKDKFGNSWYEYVNPLQIPAKRAIAAEVATRFADMNLTKDNFITLMNEMKKKANEGNIVELFSILGEIEFRLNFIGEEQTLIELACCYYLMGDEDETDYSDIHKERKVAVLKEDTAAKDFFIQGAFKRTIKYSDMSEADILDYLIQNAPNAEKLNQLIATMKSEGILKTSIT